MELQNYTREQMAETVERVFTEVTDLFKRKNGSYGRDNDAFGNFRQATTRIRNSQEANEVFDTLMIYVEKHLYALYQNKLDDNEFEERVKDIIVYMLLSLGMKKACSKVDSDFENLVKGNHVTVKLSDCEFNLPYIKDINWDK